jgi:hypothetical protein
MKKPNARPAGRIGWAGRFLWLVVLTPILAISAYSLYWVARYLGVPPIFAIGMSTCFDGVALLCADYSLKYAQVGLSGSGPRAIVRIFALIGAFLQTLHARIGDEPAGSWVLWASLPIAAVVIYDVHHRYTRRVALARMGVTYPAPLPAFGLVSWVLFPIATAKSLREIVDRRSRAIKNAALARSPLPGMTDQVIQARAEPAEQITSSNAKPAVNAKANVRPIRGPKPREVRAWAKANGYTISDRARIPANVWADYAAAHQDEGVA